MSLISTSFVKKLLKIFTGASISQIINLIFVTILADNYAKEDFGDLDKVASYSLVIGGIMTLRYELALMLPRSLNQAFSLYLISLISTTILALSLLISNYFFSFFPEEKSLFIIISAVGLALYELNLRWLLRLEYFSLIMTARILRAFLIGVSQYLLFTFDNNTGLIIGYLLGHSFSGFTLLIISSILIMKVRPLTSGRLIWGSFLKYVKFVAWALPATSVSTLANYTIPVHYIEIYYSKSEVGIFGMMRRVLLAPVTLISQSMNQVVFQEFTKKLSFKQNVLSDLYRVIKSSVLVASFIAPIFFITYELDLISFILGDKWQILSEILLLMLPAVLISVIFRPVIRFAMFGRSDLGLILQVLLLLFTLFIFNLPLFIGSLTFLNIITFYSLLLTLFTIVQFSGIFILSKNTFN